MRSITEEKAFSSARSGVMSLKTMPFCGKSGMSRISPFSSAMVLFMAPPRLTPPAFGLALRSPFLLLAAPRSGPSRLAGGRGTSGDGCDGARRLELPLLGDRRREPRTRDRAKARAARPGLGPGPDLLVARLPLLEQRQDGGGHEDRRVGPRRH